MSNINADHIKTFLIDYLINNYNIDLIASEVPYLFGYRRADLLAIMNNDTIAFEIKSELDSLTKLLEQINDYIDVFNKVYVVLAIKHRNSVILSKLPQKVGIIYIDNDNNVSIYRKAKIQKILNPQKLIYFFKKEEMTNFNNINVKLSLRKIRDKFLKINSKKIICEYSKKILKEKYSNKYKTFLNEKGNYTVLEDLLLLTGINKNNQILRIPKY